MITMDGDEHLTLFLPHYNVHLKVLAYVTGAIEGAFFDITESLIEGEIAGDLDQVCSQMTMKLVRGSGSTSLAPRIRTSVYNAVRPLIYGGTRIELWASISLPGAGPGIYSRIWTGRIQDVNTTDTVDLVALDVGAYAMNHQIQTEAPYGGPMEDVIAAIMTANGFPPSAYLLMDGAPDFTIDQYMQQPVKVMEAIRLVAQQRGWDLRWFESVDRYRCYDPDRTRITTDATITANDYISFDNYNISDKDVRNWVRVWYQQETGGMTYVEMEDVESQLTHGIRFAQIPMRKSKLLNNLTVATRYCSLALDDMKFPLADHQVTMPLFPIVEINDFYRYVANQDHYDEDQLLAISGYRHSFTKAGGTTQLLTRGAPAAAFVDYRRGEDDAVAVSTDDAPANTYLDGPAFPEGYIWAKTTDIAIPT